MGYNRDRRHKDDKVNITVNVNCEPKPDVTFYGHVKDGVEQRTVAKFEKHGEPVEIRLNPNDSKEQHYKQVDKFLRG